jgi:hypothetical protein
MPRSLSILLLLVAALAFLLPASARAAHTATNDVPLDMEEGLPLSYPNQFLPVYDIYWHNHWDTTQKIARAPIEDGVQALFGFGNAHYGDKLGEYGAKPLIDSGYAQAADACPPPKPGTTVTARNVVDFLRCEFKNEPNIPKPGSSIPGDRIYQVILPEGVKARLPFTLLTSCADFSAYHFDSWPVYDLLNAPIIFTVIPLDCVLAQYGSSEWATQLWRNMSEEVVEAATDPSPPFYWLDRDRPPYDWLSRGEAADICTNDHPGDLSKPPATIQEAAQRANGSVPYADNGFNGLVHAYWSNADNACVVGSARVTYTEFSSSGLAGAQVYLNGVAHPSDYKTSLRETDSFHFSDAPSPGAGRRYVQTGKCSGTIGFAGPNATADAAQSIFCGYSLQDEVDFTESGLPAGTPWQVTVNGAAYDAPPPPQWVNDGDTITFAYAPVQGCTLTRTDPTSPLRVAQPTTVTAYYDCTVATTTYADEVRADSPIAYWRLEESPDPYTGESAGITAADASGHGYDGTYESGVALGQPGPLLGGDSAAGFFSGTGVVVPSYAGLDLTGSTLTVECWAKGLSPQGDHAYLVSKSDWHGTLGYGLYTGANATLRFFVGTGSAQITAELPPGFAIWDGNWHHIVGTYDGTAVRLYVDKAEVASATAGGTVVDSASYGLALARFNGGGFPFSGQLDEVAVYDHVLPLDRIHAHYNEAIFGSVYG